MISGVAIEKVQKMREELDEQERRSLGGMTVKEMGFGQVLIDNDVLDETEVGQNLSTDDEGK